MADKTMSTYRYLRIAMPVLVVLLGSAVLYQVVSPTPNCWLGSISAYYYTAARAVFVACLCAIGTCLVVYRGNTDPEDFALNVSGMVAFVVAFVPTPLKSLTVSPSEASCGRSNVPSDQQLQAAIDNNMLALLIAASVVFVVAIALAKAGGDVARPAFAVFLLALAISWSGYAFARPFVRHNGHLIAAFTLFGGIVVVVLLNSWDWGFLRKYGPPPTAGYRIFYRIILLLMVAAAVVLLLVAWLAHFDHVLFWLESILIFLFAVYWGGQSKELWGVKRRGVA
jgi:hypothetical protein